jgi:hypothetical protein
LSAKDERDMDRLADQMAENRAMQLAATRLGMSIFRAQWLWHRICIRLGSQAE